MIGEMRSRMEAVKTKMEIITPHAKTFFSIVVVLIVYAENQFGFKIF